MVIFLVYLKIFLRVFGVEVGVFVIVVDVVVLVLLILVCFGCFYEGKKDEICCMVVDCGEFDVD